MSFFIKHIVYVHDLVWWGVVVVIRYHSWRTFTAYFVLFLQKSLKYLLSWKEAINKKWLNPFKESKTRHQGLYIRQKFTQKAQTRKLQFYPRQQMIQSWNIIRISIGIIKTFQWTFQGQSKLYKSIIVTYTLEWQKTKMLGLFNASCTVYS